jgi:hypothetical protein
MGRSGQCLEQVISDKPIPWSPLPDPFTLAGDAHWADYSISIQVRFVSDSPATLIGRIDSSDVFKDGKARWPSGYVLRIAPSGAWEILSAEYKKPATTLASGSIVLDRSQWHRIQLSFRGDRILASLDGEILSTVSSTAHSRGMFAIGAEWGHVQFDNLSVTE